MDREQRGRIRQLVLFCRQRLEQEFDELLRLHGLLPERALPAGGLPGERLVRREELDWALLREGLPYHEARRRWLGHAAFTFLNRLFALRVAEVHGVIKETVITRPRYGNRSLRERDLVDADPALTADPAELARRALAEASAELAIPLLFLHSGDPYSILDPRLPAYREVRERVAAVPEEIWQQFEFLGWAYQYFNSEVRSQIRARLRRNPRPDDIPPINQFYTVGWIVKFLVENTIGRLWLESRPASRLKNELSYLVRSSGNTRLSRRELKVENFKVLDPACGSGHFLLQAFDLLFAMWREAHPEIPPAQIPAKILEHNLYGVDIDLRACQIAALALYLKGRVVFEKFKEAGDVFSPGRLNIICADIRFLDGGRRALFLKHFEGDKKLRQIVEQILAACEKAFHLGSLLDIQQPLEDLFRSRVKPVVADGGRVVEQMAFPFLPRVAEQLSFHDLKVPVPKEMTVEEIWCAVREFISQYTEKKDMGTMFFGLDAERAINLVDVLSEQYDVVLMNPPYGAMPAACKEYAREYYPLTHSDYYAAFIERAVKLTRPGGYVGALTGRTFMFLKSFARLRTEILRTDALPEVFLDLGFHVLDEATARYAAFTLRKRSDDDGVNWKEHPVTFFRLTPWHWDEKRVKFEEALQKWPTGLGGQI
ncbi:MAG: DNA methyltransferase [Bacillota bacterium]